MRSSIPPKTLAATKGILKGPVLKGPAPKWLTQAASGSVNLLRKKVEGVDDLVVVVRSIDPLGLIELERRGVAGGFLKDLSKRMQIPTSRVYQILGIPKATAEKKAAAGEMLKGSDGCAALGMARLLGMAQEMAANSTAEEAADFDAAKWLGQWLDRPQPALGGSKPSDLLDTPTGLSVVARLLGSIESGAYQ